MLTLLPRTARANLPSGDLDTLNGLLEDELNAVDTYTAGAGILMKPPSGDPNEAIASIVLAVAGHFQSQHKDHASALSSLVSKGGGRPVTTGSAQIPKGFKPSVLNVIRLAANAEKAAAIAYTAALKSLGAGTAATLAAAIGGVEAEHFVVLYSLAKGLVEGTTTTMGMASAVVPTSFLIKVGSGPSGLDGLSDFTYG